MQNLNNNSKTTLDCLLIFVPKFKNYYKPIGEHMFIVLLPMGLMSIADFVHRKGYQTQILHLGLEKINNPRFSLRQYLAETDPKVIGLSLHWHYQCHDTIEIAREIKQHNSNIFIVLGGLTASYFHEEILREFDFIDGIVRGDGEVPFLNLLEEIFKGRRDFSGVPNLTWRENKEIIINEVTYISQDNDLDKFNFTNFKLLRNYESYIKMKDSRGGRWLKGSKRIICNKFSSTSYFPLLIHKGCYANCSYCGGSILSQKIVCGRTGISIRSPEKVVETLKEAKAYGFQEIYISYLPFTNRPDYFEQLFEALKKEQIGMNYFLECWTLPTKKVIQAFKDICNDGYKLYIGISPETGSEEIRRFNKGLYYDNNELIETLSFINSFKIPVILYFSIGLPGETIEDINITLNFQRFLRKKFNNIFSISVANPVLEPVSPMYIYPEKYGIVKTRNSFKDFMLSSEDANRAGFLTPRLGYFKQDFYPPIKVGSLSREDSFRNYLQKVICGSSCRLSDFIISNFLNTDTIYLNRLISLVSRCACDTISVFRNIKRSI